MTRRPHLEFGQVLLLAVGLALLLAGCDIDNDKKSTPEALSTAIPTIVVATPLPAVTPTPTPTPRFCDLDAGGYDCPSYRMFQLIYGTPTRPAATITPTPLPTGTCMGCPPKQY